MAHPSDVFEDDVGTWDVEMTFTPAPGAASTVTRARSVHRRIGRGRWLVADLVTEGGDFAGHGVYGYDEVRRCYVSTWVDDLRPFLVIGEGEWDPAARTMTFHTRATVGGAPVTWREVTTRIDADTHRFEHWKPVPVAGGEPSEHVVMSAIYRRVR